MPYKGYVRFEIDTFAMDNSDTQKEDVSRTYQGFDGYCPIAGYLGNEGWNVGLELWAGKWHSARQPGISTSAPFLASVWSSRQRLS